MTYISDAVEEAVPESADSPQEEASGSRSLRHFAQDTRGLQSDPSNGSYIRKAASAVTRFFRDRKYLPTVRHIRASGSLPQGTINELMDPMRTMRNIRRGREARK